VLHSALAELPRKDGPQRQWIHGNLYLGAFFTNDAPKYLPSTTSMAVCHRNYELLGIAQVCSLHLHNKSCKNHQRYFKRHVQSADSRVRTDQTALVALCAEIHVHLCHKLRAACALGIRRWRHGIKGHGAAKFAKLCQIEPLRSHFGAMETPALGTLMAIPRFSYWLVPKGTRPPGTKVLTGKEFPSSEPQPTWETRAKLPLHDESIPDP